jgi:asparagine synthase (glutamine-hydrolysing)
MCGLFGSVGIRQGKISPHQAINSLIHRGPDDAGTVWIDERVFFAHRRLKIIDLSEAGRQPMSNNDGSIWIIYNGEVYNYRELREKLLVNNHQFKTKTDTEVVLRLYEEKKDGAFKELNGMFSIALYDKNRMSLILVRDRLGIKPLYYYYGNGCLIFGSEIKVILASGLYSPDINWQGLYDYFTYLYIPCPETIFQEIYQLPPAHILQLDLRTNELRTWRYWQMQHLGARGSQRLSRDCYEENKRTLRELLKDSVQRQMISDVPLGVFLSGGVDSTILTGLMAQTSSQPVRTFTVVFRGENVDFYDERETARAVADKFGTAHHEIDIDIGDPAELLNLVEFFDQPFGNPTFYLMYLISKHTRQEATVALCGAGGDELFAGYPRYRAMALAQWLRWAPGPLFEGMRRALDLVSDDYHTLTLRRARKFLDGFDEDFARQFVKWTYFFTEPQKKLLLRQDQPIQAQQRGSLLPSERIIRRYLDESPLEDFGNRVLHVDAQTFLLDNLLEYTDKMSMAVGLEVRVPYLDHRVVEHSLSIPFARKLRGRRSKVILKEAFTDLFPKINRKAPKKGFNAPLAIWMREHLDTYFDRFMTRKAVERQGILNWEYIQLLRQRHREGKYDNSYALLSIIMFDVWYRRYILQDGLHEILCT